MKRIAIAVICLFSAANVSAQNTNEDSNRVIAAGMDYIEGFYEGDTAKIIRSIWPAVSKYGYWMAKDSTHYGGEAMTYKEMIKYAADVHRKNRPVNPSWPKKVDLLDLMDQTACIKVTAWWGIDYLSVAKVDGVWMTHYILWQGPLKTDKVSKR